MTDDERKRFEALEGRLAEAERLIGWCREQMPVHAKNSESAMNAHKGAMDAFDTLSKKVSPLEARVTALEAKDKAGAA